MSTQSSLLALKKAQEKSPSKKQQILTLIRERGCISLGQILFVTGMPYSTVTARLSDLADEGLIRAKGTYETQGGEFTNWETTPLSKIKAEASKRHKEKLKAWIKKGLTDFGSDLPIELIPELEQLNLAS